MAIDVNLQELRPLKNFGDGCPGCGSMIALKLLLQTLDNFILVNATGSVTPFIKVPMIHAGLNAVSVAKGVAHSVKDEKNPPKVVVFAGDGSTSMNLNALMSSDNILYVCYNDFAYTAIDHKMHKSFARQLSHTLPYVATTCVSYPDDYITKLKKAATMTGTRYIEVLAPCPVSWGYEPSNTIEVGRVAVETGLFPVFEVENDTVTLTKRPNRLEPVEHFNQVQKKMKIENTQNVQEWVNKKWKALTDGRLL
ncbi:MAG TPA: thiamine pyrophosphate-dependent enzyme [archaeon]|nr:thiamine pyrophosphate-dependent enzyme [archaeon]